MDAPDNAYTPGPQPVHEDAPLKFTYVPRPHRVQLSFAPYPDENLPSSQSTHADTPASEYVPLSHAAHAAWPVVLEYDPAKHSEHIDDELAPEAVENVPTLQAEHRAELLLPLTDEYVPGRHS